MKQYEVHFTDDEVDAYELSELMAAQKKIGSAYLSCITGGYKIESGRVIEHYHDSSYHGSPMWEVTPGDENMTRSLKLQLLRSLAAHAEGQMRRNAVHALVSLLVKDSK